MLKKRRLYRVLCWFDYLAKSSGLTQTYQSSVMIEVESSSQILNEFQRCILRKLHDWGDRTWTPKPFSWDLTAYLPETGRAVF